MAAVFWAPLHETIPPGVNVISADPVIDRCDRCWHCSNSLQPFSYPSTIHTCPNPRRSRWSAAQLWAALCVEPWTAATTQLISIQTQQAAGAKARMPRLRQPSIKSDIVSWRLPDVSKEKQSKAKEGILTQFQWHIFGLSVSDAGCQHPGFVEDWILMNRCTDASMHSYTNPVCHWVQTSLWAVCQGLRVEGDWLESGHNCKWQSSEWLCDFNCVSTLCVTLYMKNTTTNFKILRDPSTGTCLGILKHPQYSRWNCGSPRFCPDASKFSRFSLWIISTSSKWG